MSELSKDKVFKNKKKDFDKNSFPSTRVKLFKKIFLSHFGKLVLVNVLCFLFFIPLIFWDLFSTLYKSNIERYYLELNTNYNLFLLYFKIMKERNLDFYLKTNIDDIKLICDSCNYGLELRK